MTHRLEQDSLGTLEVPAEALYGIQTARSVVNLSFSGKRLSDYPRLVASLCRVKRAAARANQETGTLPRELQRALCSVCDAVLGGDHLEHFVVDVCSGGGGIAINSNLNEVLANLANEALGGRRGDYTPVDPREHVNASQSSADVCHTAFHLSVLEAGEGLDSVLEGLAGSARAKAAELSPVQVMARTCLQEAMPVGLGHTFGAFAVALERLRGRVQGDLRGLLAVNLGGTVIGSGEGATAAYRKRVVPILSEETGFGLLHHCDLYDSAQNIDRLAALSGTLANLAGILTKFAKDLRLLSGFGELVLPAVQEGSSFFTGKINPVVPETLVQCCMLVSGSHRTVEATLEHGELNLNVFEPLAGVCVLDSLSWLRRALLSFKDRCLEGIEAGVGNTQRFQQGGLRRAQNPAGPLP